MIILRNKRFSRPSLEEIDSKKGRIIISPSSIIATKSAKKAANRADNEGKEDIEIIKEAKESGRKTGKKVGTIVGTGIGVLEAAKETKDINKATKWLEGNSEKVKEIGKKGVEILRDRVPEKNRGDLEEVVIIPGKKIAKKILKDPKKSGKTAKIVVISGAGLGVVSSRALGERLGEYSAERNTVARLEDRYKKQSEKDLQK